MEEAILIENAKIRLRKLISAIKKHNKKQSQREIAKSAGIKDTAISRIFGVKYSGSANYIAERISKIEEAFSSLVYFNTESKEYTDLVPLPKEEPKKVIVETIPFLSNFQFVTKQIDKGVDNFCILDTWTHYLNQGGERYITDWFGKVRKTVRILILHPLCDAFRLRIASIPNEKLITAQGQLLQSLETLVKNSQNRDVRCKVEVRLYEEIPALNAYILDDTVHYGYYLMGDLSQNFFFSHTEGRENYIVKQISTHFDSIWNNPRTSTVNLSRINALRDLTEMKNTRSYELGEEYCMYNFDELGEGVQLQTSTLGINRKDNTCTLILTKRLTDEVIQLQGRIKVVSQGNTMFSFIQGHFFLQILIAPLDHTEPAILQAVYIHSDSNSFPKGSFAFLTDSKKLPEFFKAPNRYKISKEGKDLNEVEKYLVYQRFSVLKFKRKKSELKHLLLDTDEYQKILQNFSESGKWGMIYPERNPEDKSMRHNEYLNALGAGEFWIELDQNDGIYKAHLRTLHIKDLKGPVSITNIAGSHFLNCLALQSEEAKVILNMTIRIGINADLKGIKKGAYNIVYQDGKIGCGLLLISRDMDLTPRHMNPLMINDQNLLTSTKFLQYKNESSIVANAYDSPTFYYPGIYDVFSYGRFQDASGESQCIIQSSLRIHSNGYAEFKGMQPHGEAHGQAQIILGNLYIELKNSSEEYVRDRKGYFVVAIKETGEPKNGETYAGVFVGLSHKERLPVGKRVIFKYLGNDDLLIIGFSEKKKGNRIQLHSTEYNALEKAIRMVTTGRLNNYIGFQTFGKVITNVQDLSTFNDTEIDLSKVFLESALYKATELHSSSVSDVLEMLRQAWLHGLPNLEDFEKRVQGLQFSNSILDDENYKNLKNRMKS